MILISVVSGCEKCTEIKNSDHLVKQPTFIKHLLCRGVRYWSIEMNKWMKHHLSSQECTVWANKRKCKQIITLGLTRPGQGTVRPWKEAFLEVGRRSRKVSWGKWAFEWVLKNKFTKVVKLKWQQIPKQRNHGRVTVILNKVRMNLLGLGWWLIVDSKEASIADWYRSRIHPVLRNVYFI